MIVNSFMTDLKFEYNKTDAKCNFCMRKKNPHPDFEEPIVVKYLKIKNKKFFICINCYFDTIEVSKKTSKEFSELILKKNDIINLINKSDILTIKKS